MAKKIATLALLIFFVAGVFNVSAQGESAPKSKGPTQSIYNWFSFWDKAKPAEKPAVKPIDKPAAKPVSRGNNITQIAYNWFGNWDVLCVDKSDRFCKACDRTCCKTCNIDCGGTCCPKCVPRD